ncbi:hypothetical protein ACIQUQ_10505 [Streptomyces sp. NPDC101118]|uniref:hypothetical protein n=1 Tax=Streptomyces sp. NPDC101118 TaxID=3366109 RepID=UPI0038126BE9
MMELFDVEDNSDPSDIGHLPPWRHAAWAASWAAAGTALGWAASRFRLGPDDVGIPVAAPGSPWPYLAVSLLAGLAAAGLLRAVATRVPVAGAGALCAVLVFLGTRASLAWRPGPAVLAAGAAGLLLVAAAWGAYAWRTTRQAAGRAAEGTV